MRTRETIEKSAGNPDRNGHFSSKAELLTLEVLLDIRDLLTSVMDDVSKGPGVLPAIRTANYE